MSMLTAADVGLYRILYERGQWVVYLLVGMRLRRVNSRRLPAREAVWLIAASAPFRLLPPLRTTTGFPQRRQISRKRRPSAKDSR